VTRILRIVLGVASGTGGLLLVLRSFTEGVPLKVVLLGTLAVAVIAGLAVLQDSPTLDRQPAPAEPEDQAEEVAS
jgi:hypothetical protein